MEHILEYEKLVSKIASRYCCYSSYEDLRQVGMIGLLKAVKKYKADKNTKFSTYAVYWIQGEILDYLGKDKNIRVSKEMMALSKKVDTYSEILKQKLGRNPSISELAFFMEEEEEKIVEAIESKNIVLSSDYDINQGEDSKNVSLYDTVPYYESGYDENILTLKCALEELPQNERKIIELRYFKDMSQSEVSKELETNQVSISRQESKILQKLRQELTA